MSAELNEVTSADIHAYYQSMDKPNKLMRGLSFSKDIKTKTTNLERMYRSHLKPIEMTSLLREALVEAHEYVKPYARLSALPWRLMSFKGGAGELPYPHTHGDTIIFEENGPHTYNSDNMKDMARIKHKVIETLIHEKIHIYQRFYPHLTHKLLLDVWDMQIVKPLSHLKEEGRKHNIVFRDNPDMNTLVYADSKGQLILPKYEKDANRKKGKKKEQKKEKKEKEMHEDDHPFELMAYKLADFVMGEKEPNPKEKEWIRTYL